MKDDDQFVGAMALLAFGIIVCVALCIVLPILLGH